MVMMMIVMLGDHGDHDHHQGGKKKLKVKNQRPTEDDYQMRNCMTPVEVGLILMMMRMMMMRMMRSN